MDAFPPTFDGLQALVAGLRGPDGCPWDREQTAASMRSYVLEETYELLEAIEGGDSGPLVEELGDVMFHLAFHVQIAREDGRFDEADVFESVIGKLVRRHPHVFGDRKVSGAREALDSWQDLKRAERPEDDDRSILDGVPRSLPALAQAQVIQQRAAGVGFDWDDSGGALDKVAEEVAEVAHAVCEEERERELGDLLFSIVNAARWMGIDAEAALRGADARFRERFAGMERMSRERGLDLKSLDIDGKEALWQEAKRLTDASPRVSTETQSRPRRPPPQ